jgi:hypothetical protein
MSTLYLTRALRCLSVQRQLADFVEENGSSVRQFKSTEAALHRPGECALFLAKEFGGRKKSAMEQGLRSLRSRRRVATDEIAYGWRERPVPYQFQSLH